MTSSAQAKAPSTFDRERLFAVIAPVVHAHGGEVVDVELKTETGGWVLRIFVEKLGAAETNLTTEQAAVDLELCSQVARDLSPALDVADLIPHRYHLEISSPGVERPLRDRRDFTRFAGQKAKLKLHHAVDGQKVLVGILRGLEAGVDGDDLLLEDAGKQHRVPFGEVSQARLVFEFGPRPRPGKPVGKSPAAKSSSSVGSTKPNKNHTK
jgi:ribosome maturation factor RimP